MTRNFDKITTNAHGFCGLTVLLFMTFCDSSSLQPNSRNHFQSLHLLHLEKKDRRIFLKCKKKNTFHLRIEQRITV